jgi:hypothetical protein
MNVIQHIRSRKYVVIPINARTCDKIQYSFIVKKFPTITAWWCIPITSGLRKQRQEDCAGLASKR